MHQLLDLIPGMFEVHITTPQISEGSLTNLIREFEEIGLKDNHYFLRVNNIALNDQYPQPSNTPITGHDIENPGLMSTAVFSNYDTARNLINRAMLILSKYGHGNFEVERFISNSKPDFSEIDVDKDFPGHSRTSGAPKYENHFEYDSPLWMLPEDTKIIEFMQRNFGVTPHQIVDFSRKPDPKNDIVSRVATIYQPTRQATLEFAGKVQLLKTGDYTSFLTEQVCLVGEPIN